MSDILGVLESPHDHLTQDLVEDGAYVVQITLPQRSLVSDVTMSACSTLKIYADQQEGAEEDADAELPQWRAFCVKRREDDDEPKHGFIPVTTQAIGVAHQLRVTVGRKSGTSATNVSGEASGTESPTLRSTIEKITVSGFSMSASPQASKVISLLNLSSKLEGLQRYQDAVEVDILCGLALMNSRRHVQAAEMFRKAENNLLAQLSLDEEEEEDDAKTPRHSDLGKDEVLRRALEMPPEMCSRAADLELLVAEVMTQHGQLNDKLIAFHRATAFFLAIENASLPPMSVFADVRTSLLSVQPYLSALLLSNFNSEMPALRSAAASGLEFVLDNIGCSIGNLFPSVVNNLFSTFPSQPEDEMTESAHEMRDADMGRYFRLFETCYDLLPHFSHAILAELSSEVILPNIAIDEQPVELKVQLLRYQLALISFLRGDLPVSYELLNMLFDDVASPSAALRNAVNKCWTAYRARLTTMFHLEEIPMLVQWVFLALRDIVSDLRSDEGEGSAGPALTENGEQSSAETTSTPAAEADVNWVGITPQVRARMNFLMELLTDLAGTCAAQLDIDSPRYQDVGAALLEILPLLTELVHRHLITSTLIGDFLTVWSCLESVARAVPSSMKPNLNSIVLPMIKDAYSMCLKSSPPESLLKALTNVLKNLVPDDDAVDFLLRFLKVYCQWIPHSIHDATFDVLDLLLAAVRQRLDVELCSTVIFALLDRYTVKSAMQRKTQARFISIIMDTPDEDSDEGARVEYLECVLECCLHQNKMPDTADDPNTRSVQLRHDAFIDKLSFACLCLVESKEAHLRCLYSHLSDIASSCLELLHHPDTKVRHQALEIMVFLAQRFRRSTQPSQPSDRQLLGRCMHEVIRQGLEAASDPDLQLSVCQFLSSYLEDMLITPDDDPQQVLMGEEERFLTMLALWDYIVALAEAPYATLQSAALWHLVICAGFHCPLIESGDEPDSNERRRAAVDRFNGMFTATVDKLLQAKSVSIREGGVRIVAAFLGIGGQAEEEGIRSRDVGVCAALAASLRTLREDWSAIVRTISQHVLSTLVGVLGEEALGISSEDDAEPLFEDGSMSIFVVHAEGGRMKGVQTTLECAGSNTLLHPREPPQELMADTGLETYSIEDFVQGYDDDALSDHAEGVDEFAFLGSSGFDSGAQECSEQGLEDIDYEDLGIFEIDEEDLDDPLLDTPGDSSEFSAQKNTNEHPRPLGPRPMSADRHGIRRSRRRVRSATKRLPAAPDAALMEAIARSSGQLAPIGQQSLLQYEVAMLHQPESSPSGRPSSPTSSSSYFRPPTPPVAGHIMMDARRVQQGQQVRARSAGSRQVLASGTGQETVIRMSYDSDGSSSSQSHDGRYSFDEGGAHADLSHDPSSSSDEHDDHGGRRFVVEPRRLGVRRPQSHQGTRARQRSNQAHVRSNQRREPDLSDQTLGIEGDDGTSDEEEWGKYGEGGTTSLHRGMRSERGGSRHPRQPRSIKQPTEEIAATERSDVQSEDDSIIVVADDEDGLDGEDEFEESNSEHQRMVQRGTAQPVESAAANEAAYSSTPRHREWENPVEEQQQPSRGASAARSSSSNSKERRSYDYTAPGGGSSVVGSSPQNSQPPSQTSQSKEQEATEAGVAEEQEEQGQESSSHEKAANRVDVSLQGDDYDPLYDFGANTGYNSERSEEEGGGRIEYRPDNSVSVDRPVTRPGHDRARRSPSTLMPVSAPNGVNEASSGPSKGSRYAAQQ